MDTIILCRSLEEKSGLYDILCRNLPQSRLVTAYSGDEILISGNGRELLLLQTEKIPVMTAPPNSRRLLIFSENYPYIPGSRLPEGTLSIAASNNTPLLKFLAQSHAHVIACGMSPKDTFTYSGKNEDSISVSLQRELTNWGGDKIEPMEVVFTFSKEYAGYDLLAYAAISVFIGSFSDSTDCRFIL